VNTVTCLKRDQLKELLEKDDVPVHNSKTSTQPSQSEIVDSSSSKDEFEPEKVPSV
jgi:hypothetical protein